jgi:hypothetical protein
MQINVYFILLKFLLVIIHQTALEMKCNSVTMTMVGGVFVRNAVVLWVLAMTTSLIVNRV